MAEPSLRFPVSTLIYYRGWYVAAAREATCWDRWLWLVKLLHDLIDISGSDGLEGSLSLDLFYCQYSKSVTISILVI